MLPFCRNPETDATAGDERAVACGRLRSRPGFVHEVERRPHGAAKARAARSFDHRPHALLAGLRTECETHFLRQQARRADQGRARVVRATHRLRSSTRSEA